MSSEGARRLQEVIDRALAPLEALHAKFAATDPGVILTCPGRRPLLRYGTGEYDPTPLSQHQPLARWPFHNPRISSASRGHDSPAGAQKRRNKQ